ARVELRILELPQADDPGRLAVDLGVGITVVAQPFVEPEPVLIRLGGCPAVRLVDEAEPGEPGTSSSGVEQAIVVDGNGELACHLAGELEEGLVPPGPHDPGVAAELLLIGQLAALHVIGVVPVLVAVARVGPALRVALLLSAGLCRCDRAPRGARRGTGGGPLRRAAVGRRGPIGTAAVR